MMWKKESVQQLSALCFNKNILNPLAKVKFSSTTKSPISKKNKWIWRFVWVGAGIWGWSYYEYEVVKELPLNALSRGFGNIANIKIPQSLRKPIYSGYSAVFDCNIEEATEPLESYESLGAFFTRKLKPGVRPMDNEDLVSPVDGTVLHFGPVMSPESVEQIKGVTYSVGDFLGSQNPFVKTLLEKSSKNSNLYHCVIYLGPGDYHGIHSPTSWTIDQRTHFPGSLLSVSPRYVANMPGLFCINERVVLSGKWKHGLFSLVPVGATNVGSIKVNFDPVVITNSLKVKQPQRVNYSPSITCKKGDEVAFFHLGSTVVLYFEIENAKTFQFGVASGQKVKLGQKLGTIQ